jgi:uncharacterized protein YdaU (DUF1376 family)
MASGEELPSQGRDAPAYQEFAASMMARMSYRQMSLAERGLLYTLRNECWVNRKMPSDPAKLARVLGYVVDDIRSTLPGVMEFFEVQGEELVCPELEKYRHYQDARRERMSEGGKKSADQRRRVKQHVEDETTSASTLHPPSNHPAPGLQALRQDQTSQNKSKPVSSEANIQDPWLQDYERASANDYAHASRGY